MSFKMPTETKREEFRKYLERTGVMDALTKALVALYEEPDKPTDALEYLRNKLISGSEVETVDNLRTLLEEARAKITQLEQENAQLRGEEVEAAEAPADLPVPEEVEQPPAE